MRRIVLGAALVLVLVATVIPEAQAATRYHYIVREQPFGTPPGRENPFVAPAGFGYGQFGFGQVGATFTLFIDDLGTPDGASIAVWMSSTSSTKDWYGCVPVRRTVVVSRYPAGAGISIGLEPPTHPSRGGHVSPFTDCAGHGTAGWVDYQP